MSDAADGTMWAAIGAGATALMGGAVKLIVGKRGHAEQLLDRAIALHAAAEERHEDCERKVTALRDEMAARLAPLERTSRDHERCGPRIAHLEREQVISRGMLRDLMRTASTPPTGLYVPDDVRAAMAAEETP